MSEKIRGLWKLHHVAQTLAAWDDWQTIAEEAIRKGYDDDVKKFVPPEKSGWGTIDKRIAKLRDAMKENRASKVKNRIPKDTVKLKVLYEDNYKSWDSYQDAIGRYQANGWFVLTEVVIGNGYNYSILCDDRKAFNHGK